jgi:AcrR family transcriptional regulator
VARTGRRPGNQDTREAILTSARQAFAEKGFDAASIRQIAAGAGVDPALVHHYFGTKDQLFLDAMQVPFDPTEIVPRILAGGVDGLGERIVGTMLAVWDSAAGGPAAALVRSAISNESIARLMRDFVVNRILSRVGTRLAVDPAEAALRANLVATQIGGLIMVRYILKFEPLASAPPAVIVPMIGATVQRYLAEPLPPEVLAALADAPATSGRRPGRRTAAPDGPATTPPPTAPAAERPRRRGPDGAV